MKNFLKEYFYFNKSERKGIFVLLIIFMILLVFYFLMPMFFTPEPADLSSFQSEIEKFEASAVKDTLAIEEESKSETQPINLFSFDPNKVSKEELLQLGFNQKLANTFINYRIKGGQFRSKEDVKKIYGMSEEFFTSLIPYITIVTENKNETAKVFIETRVKKPSRSKIDLNVADSLTLLMVNGIGPVFAKRIIKFRERLGGFYKIEQLKEVYGIDSAKYNSIYTNFIIDPDAIRKININTCSDKDLGSHPYIGYKTGNVIINYRKQHGNFKSFQELKNISIITEDLLNKISPYLTI